MFQIQKLSEQTQKSNQEKWRSNYEGEEGLEVAEVSDGGADFLLPGERLAAELLRFGGGGGVVAWELISESIRLTQPIFEKQNQINSNQIGEYLIKKREKWCDSGTRTECVREREREREVVIGSWKWPNGRQREEGSFLLKFRRFSLSCLRAMPGKCGATWTSSSSSRVYIRPINRVSEINFYASINSTMGFGISESNFNSI